MDADGLPPEVPPEVLALDDDERQQLARLLNDVQFLSVITGATEGEVKQIETPDVPPQVMDAFMAIIRTLPPDPPDP